MSASMVARKTLTYCADQLRRYDRDRFQVALFASEEWREAIFALYAFNLEIAKTAESVTESTLGQIRLQWWRERIDEIYAGQARAHQVIEPLARAVRDLKLTRELFDRLLDGREFDLEGRAPRDLAELETYAEATSASLIHLSLEILGAEEGEDARVAGRHVGIAYALTGLLAAVPFHARQKRVYLPEDHLAVAGVDRGLLFELQGSEPLSGVAMRLAGRAREHLEAGRAAWPGISRAARMALLPAVVAERRLDRLAKADFDPFAPELADPDHLQVWHLAWKSLRGRY